MTQVHEAVKTRHKETSRLPDFGAGSPVLLGEQSVTTSGHWY